MSKTGRYTVEVDGRIFIVEPQSEFANRNADWEKGMRDKPKGGATHPDDSVINKKTCKNIITLPKGSSPESYIRKLIAEGQL